VSDIDPANLADIAGELNALLADVFCLYLKTKNFHWHMSGPQFRDYHLLLDEHGDQLFSTTDVIAARVRKLGGTTIRSIGISLDYNGCLTTMLSLSGPKLC
jgi:starvation-inducible DNA-binding protein